MGNNNAPSANLTPDQFEELKRKTHFSGPEIREWHEKFVEDFPEGVISKKEFVDMYQNMTSKGGDATEFAEHLFRAYDTDNSGSIDFMEFIMTMSVSTRGTVDEKLEWAFAMYDVNGDGKVSKQEATDIIFAIYKMRGQKKSEDEAAETANQIFLNLDKNRDHNLSKQEFILGIKRSSYLLKLLQGTD